MHEPQKSDNTVYDFQPLDTLHFATKGFGPNQKEQAFKPVLLGYLAARGYVVAKPEPDLGDDIWFVEERGYNIHRGQIKSAHYCRFEGGTKNHRAYNFRLQPPNFRKWISKREGGERPKGYQVGYVYFLAMADSRFNGVATAPLAECDRSRLRVDMSSSRPPVEILPKSRSGKTRYGTVTTGFHIACIPAEFFAGWFRKHKDSKVKERNKGNTWILLNEELHGSVINIRYTLQGTDITKYCGQVVTGVGEAVASNRVKVRTHRESHPDKFGRE